MFDGEFADLPLPIIQAPMAGVQGSELAIAVSSAGAPSASNDPSVIHAPARE